jgi:hypothetical protein
MSIGTERLLSLFIVLIRSLGEYDSGPFFDENWTAIPSQA